MCILLSAGREKFSNIGSSSTDEENSVHGSDSYSTSAFEAPVAEDSPPAQITTDYSVSSLSRVGGSSSDNCRRRTVQGNYEAETDDPPTQLQGLAETDAGAEQRQAHRSARNCQCYLAVPTLPTGAAAGLELEEASTDARAAFRRRGDSSHNGQISRRLSAPDSPTSTCDPPPSKSKVSVHHHRMFSPPPLCPQHPVVGSCPSTVEEESTRER